MAEQNLILNIVTFSPPKAKQDFSFFAEKKEGFFPIAKHEFPLNINDIIDKSITDTAEFLYTDFSATKVKTKFNFQKGKLKTEMEKEYRKAMYDWAKENYQGLTDKEIATTLGFSRLDILLK